MMKQQFMALFMAACLCLTSAGCKQTVETGPAAPETPSAVVSQTDMFTDRDYEVGYSDYVTITLSDGGSSADGGGVSVKGDTLTIAQAGAYLLTGALSDGQIVVDATDAAKVQLVLDNVSVTNHSSAAIYVKTADKVFLTQTNGSVNALRVSGDYVQTDDNTVDAVIFSKCDLTLNGSGTLTIQADFGHGVVSKDDLRLTGGSYAVTAASSGLSGKDSVRIADGNFTITSGKDGIHAENADDASKGFVYIGGGTFEITAGGDGIAASGTLAVRDGTFAIIAGGGSDNAAVRTDAQMGGGQHFGGMKGGMGGIAPDGTAGATPARPNRDKTDMTQAPPSGAAASADTENSEATATESVSVKGLKADGDMALSGGSIVVDAADDAIHTNGTLSVTGGKLTLSSGDDGMHADGALTVTDGSVEITKSYEGIEGAAITISGGTLNVTSSDDGLNAAGGNDGSGITGASGRDGFNANTSASILISGGTLTVDAQGDGIDSNGTLTVSGGVVYVNGPTSSANGALDCGGSATVTGGVVIAAGASGMAVNFGSGSTQGSILYHFSATRSAGTEITLTAADGTVVAAYAPTKDYQCVVISAPEITVGAAYTMTSGSETAEIVMTDLIYGPSAGMGGHGGKGMMTTVPTTGSANPTI